MPMLRSARSFFAAALALAPVCAWATPIGTQVSQDVSQAVYQHYHQDLLYTHAGDNKGISGAQHDLCRENIRATFESFGLATELHPFVYQAQTYYNVVATKVGTEFPSSCYVVGAHYDTVNNPGADDDASGVAGIMELARVFAQYDTRYSIRFIAFDREEQGLRGSTAWVSTHPGENVRAMIQLDMIAHDVGGRRQDIWSNASSAPLKNALIAAAALYGNGIGIFDAGPASFSDHAPFQSAGYQAACFVEHSFQQFGCYHQPCDNVEQANYIHYAFAVDLVRTVAGHLADAAGASFPCPADLSGDGIVGAADLASLLGAWGATGPADLDGNGSVGSSDLAALLGAWGACP